MKCMMTRWRISAACNEGRLLPAGAQQHLSACVGCRRYATKVQLLDEVLGAGCVTPQTAPAHLHTRIMASLHEARDESASAHVAWGAPARLAVITATALLLVALGSIVWINRSVAIQGDVAVRSRELPAASMDGYRRIAVGAIHDASTGVTLTMTTEMESLKADATSAGKHLWACLEPGHT